MKIFVISLFLFLHLSTWQYNYYIITTPHLSTWQYDCNIITTKYILQLKKCLQTTKYWSENIYFCLKYIRVLKFIVAGRKIAFLYYIRPLLVDFW